MWINFESCYRFAIKIHVGGVNAISGEPMMENPATRLRRVNRLAKQQSVQDYIVTPDQLWLDGIASQDGCVRQFVAMPLGSGYSVEAQVTGKDLVGGLQFEITPAEYEPAILPPLPFKCKPPPGAEFPAKQLFAKTVTGKTMTLNGLSLFTTVDNLKEMIECKEGYPPDELRLIYSGRQLDDGKYLKSTLGKS